MVASLSVGGRSGRLYLGISRTTESCIGMGGCEVACATEKYMVFFLT